MKNNPSKELERLDKEFWQVMGVVAAIALFVVVMAASACKTPHYPYRDKYQYQPPVSKIYSNTAGKYDFERYNGRKGDPIKLEK